MKKIMIGSLLVLTALSLAVLANERAAFRREQRQAVRSHRLEQRKENIALKQGLAGKSRAEKQKAWAGQRKKQMAENKAFRQEMRKKKQAHRQAVRQERKERREKLKTNKPAGK
ncbi:MAG: hypothetical protein JW873_04750 [Candidatus Saganbacteria bacterium]|nr:hypothetical protein [Candidatus Saganbacteria bacterium]